jgi:D-alanyl-lipoteichoic acid acyltransferase DltB (MBOAT superfamily)
MTLTSFFREFVYIPLGGNRKGLPKQILFILVVFFLTGLWHGAGWTFVVWGCLHGVLVAINHLWQRLSAPYRVPFVRAYPGLATLGAYGSRLATLLCVVSLWVVFRADSFPTALKILGKMFIPVKGPIAMHTPAFPDRYMHYVIGALLGTLILAVLVLPNSFELVRLARRHAARRHERLPWLAAAAAAGAFYIAVTSIAKVQSDFIYFNF